MSRTPDLPSVSVITPSLNQGEFLERGISSVLDQTPPPLEYFVLDGGSRDESVRIIRRHADRLSGWTSAPDGGQAAALAQGFRKCTGDVLGWLNSDDFLFPGALDAVSRAFAKHPDVDLIYGDIVLVDADERPLVLDVLPSFRIEDLHRVCCIPQQGAFWRRRAYQVAGGIDETLRFCMDYELFLRLARHGRIMHIPRLLAAFRQHPAAKTTTMKAQWMAEERMLRERYLGRPDLNLADRLRMKWLTARQIGEIARRRIKGERFPTLVPARWNRIARRRLSGEG